MKVLRQIPSSVQRPLALSTLAIASCLLSCSALAENVGSRVPYDVYAQVNSRLHEDGTHQMANVQDGLESVRHFAENAPICAVTKRGSPTTVPLKRIAKVNFAEEAFEAVGSNGP